MIGNDRFVQVFGSVPAGDDTLLVQIVANAVREGFHIVLCEPGTATPVCTLPDRLRSSHFDRNCALEHVLSLESILGPAHYDSSLDGSGYDPKERAKIRTKVQAIINRVTKTHGAKPNIGVIPGPSGYVAVHGSPDSDRFREMWQRDGWTLGDWSPGMTVKSPGADGYGFWWFTHQNQTPIQDSGSTLGVMWCWNDVVLVPPSVLDVFISGKGVFEVIGQTSPAPAWLLDRIGSQS